ncbi:MAG: nucleotidyltransferase [Deltaproteobacteria bacterium]|nr:nucleotidyltransferase [Deltaproteobacteria bacterium]
MIGPHLQLFRCLNDHGVEYLLIGGMAVIAYGFPRATKDIDIFINPTATNAVHCLEALEALGFGTAALTTAEKLAVTEVTIFKDLFRLDVLTQVKGIEFLRAWQQKVFFEVESILIPALSRDDLIASKRAAGRPGDLEDIKVLEMAQRKEQSRT